MKEKITEVLNDETIETVEGKVDKIAKEIALLTVPKKTYNDLSERLKNVEAEKTTTETELEDLKLKSLTEEQVKEHKQAELDKKMKELSVEVNKFKAERIFREANIKINDEKMKELLNKVVSEDEAKTIELSNSFAEILKSKVDETKTQTTADLLVSTPKPDLTQNGNNNQTKELTIDDFIKMDFLEKKKLFSDNPEQYQKLSSEIMK